MSAPQRVQMPKKNGRQIPCPIRWACDQGHVHPSRRLAVRCNQKHRPVRDASIASAFLSFAEQIDIADRARRR